MHTASIKLVMNSGHQTSYCLLIKNKTEQNEIKKSKRKLQIEEKKASKYFNF